MTFHLDEFLPYRLSVAASQISRRFAARYAKEAGLTIPEWRVLAHLDHSGAVSVRASGLSWVRLPIARRASGKSSAAMFNSAISRRDSRWVGTGLTSAENRFSRSFGLSSGSI